VPHYLPGQNPYLKEYSTKFHLPFEAPRAGAEAMYPEYQAKLKELLQAMPTSESGAK
jgi:hypothetical protein